MSQKCLTLILFLKPYLLEPNPHDLSFCLSKYNCICIQLYLSTWNTCLYLNTYLHACLYIFLYTSTSFQLFTLWNQIKSICYPLKFEDIFFFSFHYLCSDFLLLLSLEISWFGPPFLLCLDLIYISYSWSPGSQLQFHKAGIWCWILFLFC